MDEGWDGLRYSRSARPDYVMLQPFRVGIHFNMSLSLQDMFYLLQALGIINIRQTVFSRYRPQLWSVMCSYLRVHHWLYVAGVTCVTAGFGQLCDR